MLTTAALIYALLLIRAPTLRFRGVLALLVTVTVVDVWSHLGIAFHGLGLLESVPLALLVVCVGVEVLQLTRRRTAAHLALVAVVGAVSLCIVGWMLGSSALLPANDPAAIPTLAQLIREHGAVPATQAPIDGRGWYYPPGFPILLACINWVHPLATLWAFKLADTAVIALTPMAWTLVVRRLTLLRTTFATTLAACVFGFVLFDRTLVLAPAMAGKNSQLLAATLLPIIFELILAQRHSWKRLPLAVFAIAGGILIHFSIIYMLATLLCLWVHARGERRPLILARVGAAFFIGTALTVPRLLMGIAAVSEARPSTAAYIEKLALLWSVLVERVSPALFAFDALGRAWPYKGLVCLTMAVLSTVMLMTARGQRLRRMSFLSAATSWSVLALVLVFAGVVPLPVSPDFTRWFSYDFTALAAASFALLIVEACSAYVPARRQLWSRGLAGLVTLGVTFEVAAALLVPERFHTDMGVAAGIARAQHFGTQEVASVFRALRHWKPRSCALVSRGNPSPGNRVVQDYKPLEYVRAFSPCYLANGSWLSLDSGLERGCDGETTEACTREVARLHPSDDLYVVEEVVAAPPGADLSVILGPYYLRRAPSGP